MKQDWWHEENRILSKMLKKVPAGSCVLDVPFGTARFLPLYDESNMKVTGLDISHDMLAEAKRARGDLLKKCQVDLGDARNLPYENDFFDVVVSFRFLDGQVTFEDSKKAILEFCRVTKKYLILELIPMKEGIDPESGLKNVREDKPLNGSLSDKERIKLLTNFGLKVVEKEVVIREKKPFMVVYLCEKVSL